jgi:predicted  nucleic acid-binding Zn-ribbon protein
MNKGESVMSKKELSIETLHNLVTHNSTSGLTQIEWDRITAHHIKPIADKVSDLQGERNELSDQLDRLQEEYEEASRKIRDEKRKLEKIIDMKETKIAYLKERNPSHPFHHLTKW